PYSAPCAFAHRLPTSQSVSKEQATAGMAESKIRPTKITLRMSYLSSAMISIADSELKKILTAQSVLGALKCDPHFATRSLGSNDAWIIACADRPSSRSCNPRQLAMFDRQNLRGIRRPYN